MTKLESLVEVLRRADYDEEMVRDIIVNNYTKPNSIDFYSDDTDFKVYTEDEREIMLEDKAIEICEDKIYLAQELIYNNHLNLGFELEPYMDLEKAAQKLVEELDFEEAFPGHTEIGRNSYHIVYEV